MITCSSFEKMFPEAVSGKLSTNEMAEFAEHRRTCPDCARFTETDAYYRTRMQTVGFVPNVPPMRIAFQRSRPKATRNRYELLTFRSLSLAAGIVLGALVVGKMLYWTPAQVPGGAMTTAPATVTKPHTPVVPPQYASTDTKNANVAKTKDSVKSSTQPIPEQFPGSLQQVSGK